MTPQYTDMQLDALRELANIGSGNAGTALSSMLGQPVDISVPAAAALPLADAVEAAGDPETPATGVVLPIVGDLEATVLLLFPPQDEATLRPPETVADMVGAILATVLVTQADQTNLALLMDSRLIVEGQQCELTFLMLPSHAGIGELLGRLGLG